MGRSFVAGSRIAVVARLLVLNTVNVVLVIVTVPWKRQWLSSGTKSIAMVKGVADVMVAVAECTFSLSPDVHLYLFDVLCFFFFPLFFFFLLFFFFFYPLFFFFFFITGYFFCVVGTFLSSLFPQLRHALLLFLFPPFFFCC